MAKHIYNLIQSLQDFSEATTNQPLRDLAQDLGLKAGHVFGFLRNAITAEKVTPPIFETMTIIGRETVLKRLQNAVEILNGMVETGNV
jgi:glutamyl-tRNA synthetase